MKMVQATIDLPEDLYLSLSGVGITRDQIVSESKNGSVPKVMVIK